MILCPPRKRLPILRLRHRRKLRAKGRQFIANSPADAPGSYADTSQAIELAFVLVYSQPAAAPESDSTCLCSNYVFQSNWTFPQRKRRETVDTIRNADTPTGSRIPWNKGKLVGPKPPLQPKHVWAIRTHLQVMRKVRDLALFNLAIDSKLRGCDVVSLKVEDVAPHGYTIERATVRQKKTGRPVRFEITEQTRQAVDEYLHLSQRKRGSFLFGGRRGKDSNLTTRQYARLVSNWTSMVGLDASLFGTHSLRRTKATIIYRKTGNLRAVQLLLGHTKVESTVRYLGIEVDDALAIAEQVDI